MPADKNQAISRWPIPSVDAGGATVMRYHHKNTEQEDAKKPGASDEELERLRQQAEQQGYQQGLQKAQQESAEQLQRLRALVEFFEHPLEALNEEIERQLAQVAVSLAQQLVRRELRTDPGEIVGLIRDSIKLLPANSRNITLRLHPEDAHIVREAFSLEPREDEPTWKLVEDPAISRGGCEIKASPSEINLTLEHRLSALAASVLGGEREAD